jgi:hypothetical protein
METKIRELSIAIATTDLHILLEEIKDLKRHLALELDLVRDRRQKQEREFQEIINEFRQTLGEIKAQFRIEAQLLNLIKGPNDAGDQKEEKRDSGGNSGGAGLQTAFVSHLRRRGLHQNPSSQSL